MEIEPKPQTLQTVTMHGKSLADWHTWLVTDQETGEPTGHLGAPCSRYGRNGDQCAWWAVAVEYVYTHCNGEDDVVDEALDHLMSLVVNDHDDVISLVGDYAFCLPPPLVEAIGGEDTIAELYAELMEARER